MAQQKNEVQSLLEKAMFQATVADFWMAGLELGVIKTNQRDEASPKEVCSGIPQFIIGVKGLAGFWVLPFQQSTVGKLVVCLMMQPCNVGR